MIRVQQIKVPLKHNKNDLLKKAAKMCRIPPEQIQHMEIVRQSIDARRKNEVCYVYTVDLTSALEEKILKKVHDKNIMLTHKTTYHFQASGKIFLPHRPIIVGAGPGGLFCAYELAKAGYAPILFERGKPVEDRKEDVAFFWKTGILNPSSNVQFGEGGAGTFSDGKLNTLIKDKRGIGRHVLKTFVEHGADPEILYVNKPHIGTDRLCEVIGNLRKSIVDAGGEVHFLQEVTDIRIEDGRLKGIEVNQSTWFETDVAIFAIGHSARDTFSMLYKKGIPMEAKPFAVGFRVEHPQEMINRIQYKEADMRYLPSASYKLTSNLDNGRGVYSFCMCPGGFVVNASSEQNRLAVNGMSYHDRAGKNANSAVIVSVTPKDYGENGSHPLSGMEFQRKLEEKAFAMGDGRIPQQLYGDFCRGELSDSYGEFGSSTKGQTSFSPLHELLPGELTHSLIKGIEDFSRHIRGYDRYDAILSGIESRTSSPLRIYREENFESKIKGFYPCGEGAGYAGGIMSAAIDGIKVAEAIAAKYRI